MRKIAEPFVVALPSGAAVKTVLRVTADEDALLCEIGDFLGSLCRQDLVAALDFNATRPVGTLTEAQRAAETKRRNASLAARKKALTADTSSRIAGSMVRWNDAQIKLAMRALRQHRSLLWGKIKTLRKRCAVEPRKRSPDGVRGYRTAFERSQKQIRLARCERELGKVQSEIDSQRPSVVVGGKARLKRRLNLEAADMSPEQWRTDWDAARRFLRFNGAGGEHFGNNTLHVDPATGYVFLNLPRRFRHLSNIEMGHRKGMYRFTHPVEFKHKTRSAQWHARAAQGLAMRYELRYDPEAKKDTGAWFLTASWAIKPAPAAALSELQNRPTLAVDLNAGWIAAVPLDPHGNPIGAPITLSVPQQGPTPRRDGQLQAAITALIAAAHKHGCASISIEDLDFADARSVGKETLGSGPKAKRFRRKIAGIPTAKFRDTLTAMAATKNLAVIAVDPAYTSKWAAQHRWAATLTCTAEQPCSTHHGACMVIGRRSLGKSGRRNTAHEQSIERCDCGTLNERTAASPKYNPKPETPACPQRQRGHPPRDIRPPLAERGNVSEGASPFSALVTKH